MADSFSSYKVTNAETSSATKFNNFVQAAEDAVNSIDNSNVDVAAAIAVSKLAAGSAGQVLTTSAGVPTWVAPGTAATYQTTLPVGPADGQETYLVDSTSAPTYCWKLRYNSTLAKWEFVGGRAGFSEVTTGESTSSASYVALGTAGPSIALPVAGDYEVWTGFEGQSAASGTAFMSYDIGATGAVDADATRGVDVNTDVVYSASRVRVKTLTAVTLTAKYRSTSGSITFQNRWMRVTPVKL